MSSKTNSQERRFLGNGKKIDVQLIQSGNSQQMENDSGILSHMERDSLQFISESGMRRSLAWDSAFFTSPGVLDPEELFETLNFRDEDNGVDIAGKRESRPLLSPSTCPSQTTGMGECNMRKSLAWDSAFFTSAGVLDAEELAIVNKGFKKSEVHLLSRIEEDVWRSAESNSTINSDYSLASLEIDLFDDIRASLVKPRKVSSNGATPICPIRREKGTKNTNSLKVPHASSRVRSASSRESKLSLKPPKIAGRANPPPTSPNRASLGDVKLESKATKAAPGKNKTLSRKPGVRDSCSMILSSMTSSKSPSSVLPNDASRFAGLGCPPSDFTGKSPTNPLRRTIVSQLTPVSTTRTSKKYSAGKRNWLVNSNDSASLLTKPKSSFCTSPASFISEWSSESSLNQRPNSSAKTRVAATCEMISFDSEEASNSGNHPFAHQEARFMNLRMSKSLACTSRFSSNASRNFRSSALRMPSPKLGFFDAQEKCASLSLNEGQKVHYDTNPTASKLANSSRYGKQQLAGKKRLGTKDWGQLCLRENNQPLKEHEDGSVCDSESTIEGYTEDNKENMCVCENQIENACIFENQVDHPRKHVEAIDFSRDLVTEFKPNEDPRLRFPV